MASPASSPKPSKHRDTYALLISGGVAGCVAKTLTAPLSRLTILFQVHSMVTTKQHAPQYAESLWAGLRKIVGKEGFLAFWKGNGTSVVHRFPYSAINFHTFESSVAFLSELKLSSKKDTLLSSSSPHATATSNNSRVNSSSSSGGGGGGRAAAINPEEMAVIRFLSGAFAGGVATCGCYPLDLVRTRLTTQVAGVAPKYKGMVHALGRIASEEGLLGLYKGLGVTLVVQMPNLAISYATYGFLRDKAMHALLDTRSPNTSSETSSSTTSSITSSSSSSSSSTSSSGERSDSNNSSSHQDNIEEVGNVNELAVLLPFSSRNRRRTGAGAATASSGEAVTTTQLQNKHLLQRRWTRESPSAQETVLAEPGYSPVAGAAGEGSAEEGGGGGERGRLEKGKAVEASSSESHNDLTERRDNSSSSSSSGSSSSSSGISSGSSSEQPEQTDSPQPPKKGLESHIQLAVNLSCGAMSGIASTLVIYPIDLLRRRMQLQGLGGLEGVGGGVALSGFKGALAEAKGIVAREGVRGLYRGLTPEICKIVPMVGTTFCVYEGMKDWFGISESSRGNR